MSDWKIIREADDPIALRLSVGAPFTKEGYIVFRGDPEECCALLERAAKEMRALLEGYNAAR